MLSEGTTTKSADQLSDAQQLLGTQVGASVGRESGSVRFTSLKAKFEPALALMTDMLLNATFPDSALERLRGRALVALAQQKDQPNAIASNIPTTLTHQYRLQLRMSEVFTQDRFRISTAAKSAP